MMYNQPAPAENSAGLEEYLAAIRANRVLVLLMTLFVAAVVGYLANQRTAIYEAESRILVAPSPDGSANGAARAPVLEREIEVLASNPVATEVTEALSLTAEPRDVLENVEVKFVPNSETLVLLLKDQDPERAATIANAFADAYVSQREATAQAYFTNRLEPLQTQKDEASAEVEALVAEISELTRQRVLLASQAATESRNSGIADLDAALSTARANQALSSQTEREARAAVAKVENDLAALQPTAAVIRTATIPQTPTGLPKSALYLLGVLLGLGAGLVAAILQSRLDTTAKDENSVSLALGTQVLGTVPVFPRANRTGQAALVMTTTSNKLGVQRARESFRRLRSSVRFLASTEETPDQLVVMFTSAFPSEGKSVTTSNTAVALAQSGATVALINADLRRPSLERLFGLDNSKGLSLFLAGDEVIEPYQPEGIENLWVFSAGPEPANSAELLGSDRLTTLIKQLRSEVDFVLIDCPPVLSAADPLVVAPQVDGVIVVVDSRTTETDDLLQVRADLANAGAKILGSVMNRDRRRRGSRWRSRAYSYYGRAES